MERHSLSFALNNQPHRDALHASGGEAATDLLPEQLRDIVAIQPIQDPASFLSTNQRIVDFSRVVDRLLNGFFGDFVEDEPLDRHLRLEHFIQVPADGLAFAVFVCREIQVFGVLQCFSQFGNLLLLVSRNDIDRREAILDVHPQVRPGFLLELFGHFLRPFR